MPEVQIANVEGEPYLCLDRSTSTPGSSADEMLRAWMQQADKLKNGEINKEEYDKWRYKYPALDVYQKRVKVPAFSNFVVLSCKAHFKNPFQFCHSQ